MAAMDIEANTASDEIHLPSDPQSSDTLVSCGDGGGVDEERPSATGEAPHSSSQKCKREEEGEGLEGEGAHSSSQKRKREEEEEGPEGEGAGGGERNGNSEKNPLWKTSLCSYYRRQPGGGRCSHGYACRYAHGEAELRPRPDNTWDPTSERAKKLFLAEGAGYGVKAGASEVEEEERPPVSVDETSLDKCLIGLPRKWASDNLKRIFDGQGILYKSAKKKKGMTVGFVSFENSEQVKNAIEVLNEKCAGAKQIKVADAIRRSHRKKPTVGISSDQSKGKDIESHAGSDDSPLPSMIDNGDLDYQGATVVEGLVSKARSARDVVTPLAHMPYCDQLEHKKNSLVQKLKQLTRNARKACPDAVPLPEWIMKSREIGGLPCQLEGILESPVINGYRNKCEFSVGYSLQGKRTVGFMVGNFREGITAVEEPINCPNVSRISYEFAMIFQDFLQSSAFPIWDKINNTGFWRQFTVREGRHPNQVVVSENLDTPIAEVMLIIQICSLGVEEELMKKEFERMAKALAEGAIACSPQLPLTTIIVQDHKGISNAAPADCPLIPILVPKLERHINSEEPDTAEARIHDFINNLCFSISPTAFFQVNTLAAERLYTLAGDWADLNPDTLLFDICCGTGTIGLTLANRVGMVVGIEMNQSAVSDAQRNAVINGIKNCRFVCGKAEDVMGPLLKEYLDMQQKCGIDSDVSGVNGTDHDDNLANKSSEEKPNECTSADVHLTNASAEQTPSCLDTASNKLETNHEESHVDRSEDSHSNGPLEHEGSKDDAKALLGYSCIADPAEKTEDNPECTHKSCKKCMSEEKKGRDSAPLCQFKNIVAIVDPPRVGLHPVVIKALRTHPRLQRLVYISCNPESLVGNAIELCTPTADRTEKEKGHRGWRTMSVAGLARHRAKSMPMSEPFRPVKAMAVDLFPHTPHCEMVMLLER